MAVVTHYQNVQDFQPQKFNPVVVAENERVKVILACFEPGQFIPVHQPGVDLTVAVVEGSGTIHADGKEQAIGPGTLAFIPAGQARGIKATTRLVLLHVVSPPPTDTDHVQVMAGLKRGNWKG